MYATVVSMSTLCPGGSLVAPVWSRQLAWVASGFVFSYYGTIISHLLHYITQISHFLYNVVVVKESALWPSE